jgi:hypothetical protein
LKPISSKKHRVNYRLTVAEPDGKSKFLCWCGKVCVLAATREVEARLPFALPGFDSDNGGEFLHRHLWTHMRERPMPVGFTRSRPYHSDNNAHGNAGEKRWT